MLRRASYNRADRKWQRINRAAEQLGMKVGRELRYAQLERGMKVACFYSSFNEGVDVCEVLGYSGNDAQYGDGGIKYNTIQDVFADNKVKSLRELEQLEDKNEYGYATYMWLRDLQPTPGYDDSGPWYYIFKGKWSRGSGAEAISFVELLP